MHSLNGKIISVSQINEDEKNRMFTLMEMFYDNVSIDVFLHDLNDKDYCIILFDDENIIQGFSTQKLITFNLDGKPVNGVFSGDTIVHKNYWHTRHPLFSVFGKFFENHSRNYDEFYWFIICKGYKTYKILPTFFNTFHPNCTEETPKKEQQIIDAFGEFYSEDYNKNTGVIEYKNLKDALKKGVADINEAKLKNKHTAFFVQKNPGHLNGDDLVCITSLKKYNYQKNKEAVLWG